MVLVRGVVSIVYNHWYWYVVSSALCSIIGICAYSLFSTVLDHWYWYVVSSAVCSIISVGTLFLQHCARSLVLVRCLFSIVPDHWCWYVVSSAVCLLFGVSFFSIAQTHWYWHEMFCMRLALVGCIDHNCKGLWR